jgi:hypothetical protein
MYARTETRREAARTVQVGSLVEIDDGAAGAVIRILEGLLEDAEEFDAILDTVGGRGVWACGKQESGYYALEDVDCSQLSWATCRRSFYGRVMVSEAGKEGQANWERNDGKVKGKGKVGYAWVSVAQDVDWEGEDVKESLRVVVGLALEKGVRPWVGRVVPFGRAPQVFAHKGRELLRDGLTAVVKIVG